MVDGNIQGRNAFWVDIGQRVRRVFVRLRGRVWRRQFHILEIDRNRRAFGVRQVHRALGLLAIELQAPGRWFAIELQADLIKLGTKPGQFAHLEVRTAEQLLGIATWIIARVAIHKFLPGIDIQFRQHATNAQALGTGQHGITVAEKQFAAAIIELVRRRGKSEIRQLAVIKPVTALSTLQGHAKGAVTPLAGGHAERCRQVHRDTLEVGVDHQLAVRAVQDHLQLVRNIAGDRQRLADFQPVRKALDGDLAIGSHPRADITRFAFGKDLRRDGAVERLGRDLLPAQALGAVEAKITLELGQVQRRLGQLQARLVGLEVHHDLGLSAFGQRYVQVQATLQVALAFPAGERRRRADRGFLKDLQAVAQTAGEPAREQQMTVPARWGVGDIDVDILDLGVEQLALARQNAYAALLDKHFAIDLVHMRPARLEGEFGIMHLEEQADIARCGQRIVAERALVLEEAFVHRALEDRRAQPFIQRRAQHGG